MLRTPVSGFSECWVDGASVRLVEMRTPIKSETEAFRLTIAAAATVGVCLLIGWQTEPLVGAVVFGLAAALALVAYLRASDSDRRLALREALHAPHPHGSERGGKHVLVVANEELAGDELRERVLELSREGGQLDILAPVLTSRLHFTVSDIDRDTERARARLEHSLTWVRELGVEARGEIGDPGVTSAIEDELRDFGADEVIVVTHPRGRETWQERDELDRLRHELDVPVTHVAVDGPGSPAAAET
jgi:YD repeat-containing protein